MRCSRAVSPAGASATNFCSSLASAAACGSTASGASIRSPRVASPSSPTGRSSESARAPSTGLARRARAESQCARRSRPLRIASFQLLEFALLAQDLGRGLLHMHRNADRAALVRNGAGDRWRIHHTAYRHRATQLTARLEVRANLICLGWSAQLIMTAIDAILSVILFKAYDRSAARTRRRGGQGRDLGADRGTVPGDGGADSVPGQSHSIDPEIGRVMFGIGEDDDHDPPPVFAKAA